MKLFVSSIEIHNEKVFDLLHEIPKQIELREEPKVGFLATDAHLVYPQSFEEVRSLI
jgi:hypothetical protein